MENARARAVARKARFDAAHRIGMKAIADRDYEMLDSALRSELSVIDEQQRDIDAMRPRPSRWRDKRR